MESTNKITQTKRHYSAAFFDGLPRFFFVLLSGASPLATLSAASGLGFFGGRPRRRLTGGSVSASASAFFSFGGRPLFLGVTGVEDPAAAAAADVTPGRLFLLPFGRPRPRFAGGSPSFGAVSPSVCCSSSSSRFCLSSPSSWASRGDDDIWA